MTPVLSIVMDVIVLICLAVTIFYALKLSKSLNNFRAYRDEFQKLMLDLSRNVDAAQQAIHNLKQASLESGESLGAVIKESKLLADELEIINEASNNMAKRLEALAEKTGKGAQIRSSAGSLDPADADFEDDVLLAAPRSSVKKPVASKSSLAAGPTGFSIRDPDYEAGLDPADAEEDVELMSRAERELYEAITGGKKHSPKRA